MKKKDSYLRPCTDYRGLKSITISNRYPLPLSTWLCPLDEWTPLLFFMLLTMMYSETCWRSSSSPTLMMFWSFQSRKRNTYTTSTCFWDACLRTASLWRQENVSSTPHLSLSRAWWWGRGNSFFRSSQGRGLAGVIIHEGNCRGSWASWTSTVGPLGTTARPWQECPLCRSCSPGQRCLQGLRYCSRPYLSSLTRIPNTSS